MIWLATALANPPTSTSFVSYPPGGSGDVVCKVHIVTNGEEKAQAVLVSECADNFANMIRNTIMQYWKWEPGDASHVEEWKVSFFQNAPSAKSRQIGELETPVADLVKVVHASTVKLKKQVAQKYPPDGDGKEATCKVEMWFESETGRIAQAKIDGCEEVFHDVSLTAAYDWSIEPGQSEQRWLRTTFPFKYTEPADVPPIVKWGDLLEMVDTVPAVVPARTRKYRPATCNVVVTVGVDGKAGKSKGITGCDASLHVAAENAVRRSTWKHLGDPRPRNIVVDVEFDGKERKNKK